ncbi:hypothetical protein ACP4OV_029673 [Aristida adscensionis]
MELSGGEVAAKRTKPSSSSDSGADGGEDRLSALPDDVLVIILLRLDCAAAAGRTSVLSRRWRRLWALLPELRFYNAPPPHRFRAALRAHEAPLRRLTIGRRLSGRLVFVNSPPRDGGEQEAGAGGAFELPCFEGATKMVLSLGFLGLAVPPAGVFARLTALFLSHVRFHAPQDLGAVVSSPRCPRLQRLAVHDSHGLADLHIHSGSLLQLDLQNLAGLLQLTVEAPELIELRQSRCLVEDQPIAHISAPELLELEWLGPYDPSSVQLGNMAKLRGLKVNYFPVYETHDNEITRATLRLLERFLVVRALHLTLAYPRQPR